jgi:hypothetical protein
VDTRIRLLGLGVEALATSDRGDFLGAFEAAECEQPTRYDSRTVNVDVLHGRHWLTCDHVNEVETRIAVFNVGGIPDFGCTFFRHSTSFVNGTAKRPGN